MNVIDIAVILMILVFGLAGAKKGFFKQVVTTIGFIIVVVLAFYLKNPLAELLSDICPFFKFGGKLSGATSLNIIMYNTIAFLIVIIILEAILNVLIKITGIIEKILKFTIILGIPSKILGFIVGVIEGFIISFIILFFLKQPAFNIGIVNDSKVAPVILNSTPILSNVSNGMVNAVNDIFELVGDYSNKELDSNTLNLKSIDIMLEHKVITKEYVRKLIDNKKITVNGIDSILNKYN